MHLLGSCHSPVHVVCSTVHRQADCRLSAATEWLQQCAHASQSRVSHTLGSPGPTACRIALHVVNVCIFEQQPGSVRLEFERPADGSGPDIAMPTNAALRLIVARGPSNDISSMQATMGKRCLILERVLLLASARTASYIEHWKKSPLNEGLAAGCDNFQGLLGQLSRVENTAS
jgi:hypothetical protein